MRDVSRLRSKKYMAYIRTLPCLICGGLAQAHHLQRAQPRAMSSKTGDQYCVPLCHKHHHELHHFPGGEDTFWAINGIKPIVWAENKYKKWSEENGGL